MRTFVTIAALALAGMSPAFAQFAPAPEGTTVDLAPIINPFIQVVGALILSLGLPLMWMWIGKTLKSWGIEATNEMNATRAVIDGIAQKAIGGAILAHAVRPGEITLETKSAIIAEAANTLVRNAGDSLTKIGVKDSEQLVKAREMIAARVGLMDAAAAGTPVPNPSQPPAAIVNTPVLATGVLSETASAEQPSASRPSLR